MFPGTDFAIYQLLGGEAWNILIRQIIQFTQLVWIYQNWNIFGPLT